MTYHELMVQAERAGAVILEEPFPSSSLKGLCFNHRIVIDNRIETDAEKTSVLAEELAHYHYDAGDILDQDDPAAVKKEKLARALAYEKLVPIDSVIEAFELCLQSREEFADHLNVTEEFLEEAIRHYIDRYGQFVIHQEYVIYFEPFGVFKSSL